MTVKLGIISDVHASPEPVAEAMALFCSLGVNHILCAGDIAGYGKDLAQTIELLKTYNTQCISGNHDRWFINEDKSNSHSKETKFLKQLPATWQANIDGVSIYMVHAHPPESDRDGIKLRNRHADICPAQIEEWECNLQSFMPDVLIVGHTHQVFAESIAGTLVVNPGSSCFNHSCAVLELPTKTVAFYALSGKVIEPVWNWGQQFQS